MTNHFKRRQPIQLFSYTTIFTLFVLMLANLFATATAQVATYTKPSWWFGAAAGVNVNFYRGSTQTLNSSLTVPTAFHNGTGAGLYLGPLVEYHFPASRWGIMLQAGYDSRRGQFKQITTPCNCPADLTTKLSYITIEPSVRFAPFKSAFYLFGGPRLAFNMARSFTYSQGTNPAYPSQAPNPDMTGDLSNMNQTLLSMQVGAGYDIPLSPAAKQTKWVLSPFVSFQPYFGQSPRKTESWNITTLRLGIALKLGRGTEILPSDIVILPGARFMVNSPQNPAVKRRIRETFPLRNYVFFDIGSSEIPDRYVLLKKSQVKEFNEEQLEVFKPKKLSGRSDRQMIVYYNVLNILGNRMQKNPTSTITLVGSSEKGPEDARLMAESVKNYLVGIFDIDASRIVTTGLDKPKISSERPGGTLELDLLAAGDRRVSIESTSPDLLMEFQSGPGAPLKPVQIAALKEAPLESYISFEANDGKEAYASWSMEITDEKGKAQYFGPYTQSSLRLPGKSILGNRKEGDYKVSMTGKTNDGKTVKKDTTVHMVLWIPPQNEEGTRFSVLFEFNESKTILMYEQYLTDIVTPQIPAGGTVIIHGYTDVIGDSANNGRLSLARANEVKSILEKGLQKAGRKDVKFEVYGVGENPELVPFENQYPEERFYNRTVVIDIIPKD